MISSLEEPTILEFDSRQNGYNVAKGGYGGDLGKEANRKRSQTMLNRPQEEKDRLADLQRNRQLGRTKLNDAGRQAQSDKIKGNKFALGHKHSPETKRIISEANKGPKSISTRQKMSQYAIMNNNGARFAGRRASCICCQREWDIGNYTQHIKRRTNVIQQN